MQQATCRHSRNEDRDTPDNDSANIGKLPQCTANVIPFLQDAVPDDVVRRLRDDGDRLDEVGDRLAHLRGLVIMVMNGATHRNELSDHMESALFSIADSLEAIETLAYNRTGGRS